MATTGTSQDETPTPRGKYSDLRNTINIDLIFNQVFHVSVMRKKHKIRKSEGVIAKGFT